MLTINPQAADRLRVVADRTLRWEQEERDRLPFSGSTEAEREADAALGQDGRFYAPPGEKLIRVEERPNARASCRACGERIERGEVAVVFGFDPAPHANPHRAARAFLHANPCQRGLLA